MSLTAILIAATPLRELLIGFLIVVVVIAIIAGLVWCIENWISPIPAPIKLVLAIIILIGVVIWALGAMGIF